MMGIRFIGGATALAWGLSWSGTVSAQAVRGTLGVRETHRPVRGAAVVLLGPNGKPYAATLSDGEGAFQLVAPRSGHYLVQAYAPNLQETRSTLTDLESGRVVEVHLDFASATSPNPTSSHPNSNPLAGFNARRAQSPAYRFRTFDARELQQLDASNLTEVLRAVPPSWGRCYTVWLDGQRLDDGDWRLDWLMGRLDDARAFPMTSLYGIEVFPDRGDAPVEYQLGCQGAWQTCDQCGVVLVWTKRQ